MNLHKHQLYLVEHHSESFKMLSAIISIYTEGKSLIMKLGSGVISEIHKRRKQVTPLVSSIQKII